MIEKQIIKLMLNKNFYTEYKGQVSRNVFQGSFGSLYDTIQKAHEKYDADISIDELYSLHTTVFNPALTRAAKEQFSELLEDIKETQQPSKQIADDIIKILIERDVAQKIAIEATEIFNGKPADFNAITNIIENAASIPDDVVIFNADWDDNQALAAEFGATSYHTVTMVTNEGKNVKGLFELDDLLSELDG